MFDTHLVTKLLLWSGVWFSGMGWFWIVKKYYGISYIHSYITVPVYLLFTYILCLILPGTVDLLLLLNMTSLPALGLYGVICVALVVYSVIDHSRELRGGGHGLVAGINHTLSKSAELLFQQIGILSLGTIVTKISESPENAVDIFTIIFLLIHIPLVGILPRFWSQYFIAFSVVGGFLFGLLTLVIGTNGWLLSLAVHHIFYIVTSWWAHTHNGQIHLSGNASR